MKRFILLMSIVVFLLSCSQGGTTTVVTKFPVQGELTAKSHPVSIPFLLPRYMGVWDHHLFVYKEREDTLFSVFRLPDLSPVGNIGIRGSGPDDFNMLDTRSFHASSCGTFAVVEAGSNLLKTVKLDGNQLQVIKREQVLEGGMANNGFYPLADSVCLTLGRLEGKTEFCLLDRRNGQVTEIGTYPDWEPNLVGPDRPPLFVPYLKTCVARPDGRRFAAFYSRFKRFRIYDNKAKLLHDVDVRVDPCYTDFEGPVTQQPVYYIGQPYATDHYIYALCGNQHTGKEERCELHVWDWEGNAVACYRLDRPVILLTVSMETGKMYAIERQQADELYVYDLPIK